MKKRFAVIAVTAFAMAVLAFALAGCGGGGNVVGQWHFESMTPTEDSLQGLSEEDAADHEAEASMLSVFMTDAQLEFKEDGTFEFTFLGDKYTGKWEKAGNGAHVTMDGDDYSSAGGTYEIKDGKLVFTADDGAGRLNGFEVVYVSGPAEAVEVGTSVVTDTSGEAEEPSDTSAEVEEPASSDEAAASGEAAPAAAEDAGSAAGEAVASAASDAAASAAGSSESAAK